MKPSRACQSVRSSLALYRQEQEASRAVVLPEMSPPQTIKPRNACAPRRAARELSERSERKPADAGASEARWGRISRGAIRRRLRRVCEKPGLLTPLMLLFFLLVMLPLLLSLLPEQPRPTPPPTPRPPPPPPPPPPSPPDHAASSASATLSSSTLHHNSPPHLIPDPSLSILLLLLDDLRPSLGAYGDPRAITPHIDSLAKQSTRFSRAYASVPTCSPSRTSLLTGMRPDSHRVYDLQTHFRREVSEVTTLPQLFRKNGYLSLSFGKIFHEELDDKASWSSQVGLRDTSRPHTLPPRISPLHHHLHPPYLHAPAPLLRILPDHFTPHTACTPHAFHPVTASQQTTV